MPVVAVVRVCFSVHSASMHFDVIAIAACCRNGKKSSQNSYGCLGSYIIRKKHAGSYIKLNFTEADFFLVAFRSSVLILTGCAS